MQRTKTVTLAPDVLDVLRRSTVTATSVKLPEQLDRALYTRVNKALAAAGGKWDRRAGAHLFEVDPRVTMTLNAGEVVNRQQTLQRFDTPDDVADQLVALAEVHSPISAIATARRCLEPSVGGGSIMRALERAGAVAIEAVDIDELAVTKLQRTYLADRHRAAYVHHTFHCADFLEWHSARFGHFDRIVMNPPFTGGQDAAHVVHAFSMLAQNGVLVAIVAPMSLSKPTRPFAKLQELVRAHGDLRLDLPRGTFEDTDVATTIIRLRK